MHLKLIQDFDSLLAEGLDHLSLDLIGKIRDTVSDDDDRFIEFSWLDCCLEFDVFHDTVC